MKMIVMDMDGTLMNSQKLISSKTKEVLMEAQRSGTKLVLASGRPQVGMVDFAYQLEMDKYDGYLISFNGARLTSMSDMNTIWEKSIEPEESKKILDHLESFDVMPMISDDKYMYVNNVYGDHIHHNDKKINIIEYESRGGNYLLKEKRSLGEDLDFNLYKILVAGQPDYLQQVHKELSDPFIQEYNAMFTAPFYYEFTHKSADKGKALEVLSEHTGIQLKNIIGFGDDLNDLPFLKIVGHSVAMENANPAIKKHVDAVCMSNDKDGIGNYLDSYLIKKL